MKKYLKKIKIVFLPLVILFALTNYIFSFLKAKAQGRDMPMICDPVWNPPPTPPAENTVDLVANPFRHLAFLLLVFAFYPVYLFLFLKKEFKKKNISRKRLLVLMLKIQTILAVILTIIVNIYSLVDFAAEGVEFNRGLFGFFDGLAVSFAVIFLILSVISGLVMVLMSLKNRILLNEGIILVVTSTIFLSLIYFYYLADILSQLFKSL